MKAANVFAGEAEGDSSGGLSAGQDVSMPSELAKGRRPASTRSKLVLLVLACVLPVWIAAGFLVYYNYHNNRAKIQQRLLDTTRALSMVVDRELDDLQASADTLSISRALVAGDLATFYRRAYAFQKVHPYTDIVVSDATAQQLLNSQRPFGSPLPKRSVPEVTRQVFATGRPVHTNIFKGAVSGQFLIGLDVPVFRDGKVVYDLMVGIRAERFADVLRQQRLPPGWMGVIFDKDQTQIASSRPGNPFAGQKVRLDPGSLGPVMRDAAEGMTEAESMDGALMVTSFSRSAKSGWTVAIGVPKTTLLAETWGGLWWVIIGTSLLSLTGIALALPIAKGVERTEARLRQSDTMVESSDDAIVGTDLQGTMTSWSQGAERLLGYSAAEMIGRPIKAIIPADQASEQKEIRRKILRGEFVRNHDVVRRAKDGRLLNVSLTVSPVKDALGKTVGGCAIARDVTEHKRSEEVKSFLAQTSSGSAQEPFFLALARYLAHSLQMDFVCIDRLEGDGLTARTVAVWYNGNFQENVSYALKDTPCGEVVDKSICCFCENVRHLFPQDAVLQEMVAESYAGTTLWSFEGKPIGLIAVIGRRPLRHPKLTEAVLEIVAPRAAAELQHQEAEQALRDNERLLRESQRVAGLGTYVLDIRKGIWTSSKILDEIFGIDESFTRSVVGWVSLVHPDDQEKLADYFQNEVLKQGIRFDKEYKIVRPADGQERWVHGLGELELDVEGQPIRMLGTIADVTERKRSEQALAESEERYRSSFNDTVIGLYRTTPQGGVLMVNPALALMLGCSTPEEMLTWNLKDYFAPEYSREDFIRELEEKGVIRGWEAAWKRADGTTVYVRESARVIRDDWGKVIHYEGTVEDISARKLAEQETANLRAQLLQSQKLESIGRLAGGIAHDFNNLLMVIRTYTEMLQDALPIDDRLRKNTGAIIKATDRAVGLTRQMLAFSRKQILSPVLLDLNAVIDDTVKMLKRMLGEDIEIRLSSAESIWAVEADADQMVQVLMNLCTNARDAMPQGGRLTIATGNVTVQAGCVAGRPHVLPGDYVSLSITDTGTGITKELRDIVFEPFSTTKEVGKGVGLGLATVHGIVKQSGGYVWVDSEPGLGACFTIYLPRVTGATADLSVKAEPLPRGTETLLIAEDEDAMRNALCEYLRSLGYKVYGAGSGQEALSVSSQQAGPIDLLITDLVMPGMSGRELAQKLESMYPGLKTIYMSGHSDDAVARHRVQELGAAFLQKPFSLRTLARRLRDTIGRRATIQ